MSLPAFMSLSSFENVIKKLGNVELAFITGDYAKGKDTGIIDLVIVGEINEKSLQQLVDKAEVAIKRKIRSLVLTFKEYEGLNKTLNPEKALWLWKR